MHQVIVDAISAGKLSTSRAAHYQALMQRDPKGTTKLIASLEAVPAGLRGRPASRSQSGGRSDAGRRIVAAAMGGYVVERS